jgi:DNA polymerase-4
MRREGFAGRTVTLKVKYRDFTCVTRSQTLGEATDDGQVIYRLGSELLQRTAVGRRPVRLVGISVSQPDRKTEKGQLTLFPPAAGKEKAARKNQALDDIQRRYGPRALRPASLVDESEG